MISTKTKNLYDRILKKFFLNKEQILENKENILTYFNELPATSQRTAIAALRYYNQEFNINENDLANLKLNYKKHLNKKEFHYMNDDHVNKLKIYINSTKDKERLILMILFDLGVRKFEVEKVIENWVEKQMSEFNIISKKGTIRKVYLSKAVESLLSYSYSKYGDEIIKWASNDTVYRITKKCFKIIGYKGACHDFRRHFAQNLDERGERLSVIKSLMGHSNIATTSIYIRQNDNELKKVIENQHKEKEIINTKEYSMMLQRAEDLKEVSNNQKDTIESLMQQIKELQEENLRLANDYKELKAHFVRLKDANKYIKNNKRVDDLIKRKIKTYEEERIKRIINCI